MHNAMLNKCTSVAECYLQRLLARLFSAGLKEKKKKLFSAKENDAILGKY